MEKSHFRCKQFKKKILARSLQTLLLMTLSSAPIYAETFPKNDVVNHTARYLDPSVWNIIVHEDDCFFASPHSMLQVEPVLDRGTRVYRVTQFFDTTKSRELYSQSIFEQIKNRKIVGREFCGGIVSMSNMDVPFVKGSSFKDANDGELLVDKIERDLSIINDHLIKMNSLATQAANGIYSSSQLSDLNAGFQALISQIDHISQRTTFNDLALFNGSISSIDIPVNNSSSIINIPLINASPENLNIASLNISSQYSAQLVLSSLQYSKIFLEFSLLKAARIKLDEAVKEDGDTIMVDVRTDDFVVQHQKSSLTDVSSGIHS